MIVIVLSLTSCHSSGNRQNLEPTEENISMESISSDERFNAIYYWKTVFDPDSAELAFLQEHNIKRLYIRYFDVVYDPAYAPEYLVPNATIQFKQPVPEGIEVVPTIFITNEAMANWPEPKTSSNAEGSEYYLEQLVGRIKAMNIRNKINGMKEVQVDCDWSRSTRDRFFAFCSLLRKRLYQEKVDLSATIRLHQLKEKLPPVARGVLMCYNTGALRSISTDNSILSESDAFAHIRHLRLSEKTIPLDIAYPTFAWSVMYSPDRKFAGLVHKTDLSDASLFRMREDNLYEVLRESTSGNAILKKGNLLRLEQSDFKTIKAIQEQLELKFSGISHKPNKILYHLDSSNLSKYSHEEIESIYR